MLGSVPGCRPSLFEGQGLWGLLHVHLGLAVTPTQDGPLPQLRSKGSCCLMALSQCHTGHPGPLLSLPAHPGHCESLVSLPVSEASSPQRPGQG